MLVGRRWLAWVVAVAVGVSVPSWVAVVGASAAAGVGSSVDPGSVPVGASSGVADRVPGGVPGGDLGSAPGSVATAPVRVGGGPVMPRVPADVSGLPVVGRGERFELFDAGGGVRVARLFAGPVNVQDPVSGAWSRIDPSLVVNPAGRLVPRVSGVPVSFGASAGVSELARMGRPGSVAVLRLAGAANSRGVVAGEAVTYPEVSPGVDLEYRVGANLVKTTLLVKNAAGVGSGVWRFPMSLDAGLTPVVLPSGGVQVRDASGQVVGLVPTPLMWDSKSDLASGDPGVYGPIRLGVEGDAASGWTLVVTTDVAWLTAPQRVFPIHVDPSYQWTSGSGFDAYVRSAAPTTNYSASYNTQYGYYENRVGYYDSATGQNAGLLFFDTTALNWSSIYSATVNTYFFHAYTVAPTPFTVLRVTSGWDAATVTWNTAPSWTPLLSSSVGRGQWSTLDVTSTVAGWVNGSIPNNGLEYATDWGVTAQWKRMASLENTNGTAPYLQVVYNHGAGMASPAAPSPANGSSVHAPAGGLVLAASATDPDGDPLRYFFRVATGSDAESGVVWESGWQTASQATVPPSAIPAGRTYYWHVYTSDDTEPWPTYATGPNWVSAVTLTNTVPPSPVVTGPSAGQVVGSLAPTVTWNTVTDADGDPLKYWVKVSTGTDGVSGQVASSGWLDPSGSSMSWTVPAGVLKDGVRYSWTVTAGDSRWQWQPTPAPGATQASTTASTVGAFRVDLRLGLAKTVPSDAVGGVSANLYNGNVVVSASSPTMATLGGPVGLSFTYNSGKPREQGLVGSYFTGLGARDFPAGEAPLLVRTDSQVAFDWGADSPYPPAIAADQFRIRWTGWVAVPATGSWQFGATHDDGVRVKIGTTTVLDRWVDGAVGTDYTGSTPVALTAGVWTPITVDYYELVGPAKVSLLARVNGDTGAGSPVPASWLSPAPAALPDGWTVSADLDGSGSGYASALVTDASAVLTDATGSTHTYTKTSTGSYTPPTGEQGVLARGSDGTLMLTDEAGTVTRFTTDGQVASVTAAVDARKPATAVPAYSGFPSRLMSLTDPVSGRAITMTYNRDGATCPAPPAGAGYDPAAPSGMLCRISYPDTSSTSLFYVGGQLSAIIDPGSETTQFRYTSGILSGYRDPATMDWVAKDPAVRNTDATWSLLTYTTASPVKIARIQSPEPTGTTPTQASGRVGHSYGYGGTTTSPTATITVDGSSMTSTVTMDATGRPVSSTTPAGQTSSTGWSATDLPLWSTDHTGRTTVTVYDALDRPTDSWGPYPDSCFTTTTTGGVTRKSPIISPACSQAMPHTSTGYDQGITGLSTTWWPNTTLTGVPTHYSTALPGAPAPASLGASSYTTRGTGVLTLPAGTYTFTAALAAPSGGVRLYVDDQPVLSRWESVQQAIAADTPAGAWRLANTTAVTGPALTSSAVTFTGGSVNASDPSATADVTGTGSLALPTGWFNAQVTATSSPGVEVWFKTTGAGSLFGYQNASGASHVPALYVGTDGLVHAELWGAPPR